VPLPAGSDPADLVGSQGAQAVQALVADSVPFVSFQVDRELAAGDPDSAEGKDRIIEALRPVFTPATLPPGALREELLKRVADRLNLAQSLVSSWLSAPMSSRPAAQPADSNGHTSGGAAEPRAALSRDERQQRAFLSLCIAAPAEGANALAMLDIDNDFTTDLLRGAARHLRAHVAAPIEELPPELAGLIPELAVRATELTVTPAGLELERLQLELARVKRQIVAARTAGSGVGELAQRRLELQGAVDRAMLVAMEDTAPTDVL
jgi:DNA primase